ncbi:MAG: hypothetical protein LBQ60_20295 [Bacteroidales bacterium]|jgi:hypothetical protein|nr:hypothetical protein [Bacteroidales bacterium]
MTPVNEISKISAGLGKGQTDELKLSDAFLENEGMIHARQFILYETEIDKREKEKTVRIFDRNAKEGNIEVMVNSDRVEDEVNHIIAINQNYGSNARYQYFEIDPIPDDDYLKDNATIRVYFLFDK